MGRRLRAFSFVCALAGTTLVAVGATRAPRAHAAGQLPAGLTALGQGLANPAAVAVASSGDYFVADAGHNRVVHYDSTGNFLGSIGQPATHIPQPAAGDLSAPTGVALDGKGNLFVADLGNSRVAEFNLSGGYIGQIGAYGLTAGKLLGPTSVAVGPTGRVYVMDTGANKVNIFAPDGKYITRWGSFGSGIGEFDGASGLALDVHGNAYVADTNNNRVQEFSPSGTYIAQWGRYGKGSGDLRFPTAVAIDASGAIWVDDGGNGRVVQIQHPQTFEGSFATSANASPAGVALAGSSVYVVDTTGEHIVSYTSTGTQQAVIAKGGHGSGQLSRPMGAATDAAGNLYIADTNNNRIEKFDSAGKETAIYGAQGREHAGSSPRFLGPQSLALDAAGNIYVADTFNSRIQKLDPNGNYVWEQRVGGQPRGIAVDASGNTYVTSFFDQKVLKFDGAGKFLTQWGGRGTTNGLFMGPSAIAVDRTGRVYVADTGNKRVAVFGLLPDGTYGYTGQFGGAGSGDGQFADLAGIAVGDNEVYAVDRGGLRVQKFNPFGARFSAWSGNGQLQSLSGLALDGKGHIVVTDTLSNRVSVYGTRGDLVRQLP